MGFYDYYDFDSKKWGTRSTSNELKNRSVDAAGSIHGVIPFSISYGIIGEKNKLMKKKNILLSLVLILVFIVLFKFTLDFFSVPTPMKYAKRQSGLDLPDGIKVARFEEHWENANGDGSRYIEFDLTKEEVEDLERQCLKKSYSNLPVKENGYDPFTSKKIDKGYYKIIFTSSHDRSHELTILDVTRKKLYLIVEIV